jgi:hypothetical protein
MLTNSESDGSIESSDDYAGAGRDVGERRVVFNGRKKDVVKASDDVMTALALARPRWAAASELAIPGWRRWPCRTFPDRGAVRAAAIGASFCARLQLRQETAFTLSGAYPDPTPCISLT